MEEINKQLSTINRIVIHPKYRTIGLGDKIIHETLPQAGTPYVELIAVMAKYSPFAEKAGMQKVSEQQSVEGIKRITNILQQLGFNLQLIGSQHHVESKLETLTQQQITEIKTVFMASKHPRFKKEVTSSRHEPYGKTADYIAYIETADNLKMAKLIKVLAMLSQTKVYLFWNKSVTCEKHFVD